MATLRELLLGHERLVILRTLQANGFSIVKTSSALGITRQALYRRVGKLKMNMKDLRVISKASRKP